MSRWLVTKGDHQFSASDLNELKELAKSGRIGAGDMVQPPSASDWLYASEVPELAELFGDDADDVDDDLDWDLEKRNKRLLPSSCSGFSPSAPGCGTMGKLPNQRDGDSG